MANRISRHRRFAYINQSRRCYYCDFPMWDRNLEDFATANRITASQAQPLRCTAEHLEARKDGGKNTKENIVAACLRCNQMRHWMQPALNPNAYRELVLKQRSNGGWHRKAVVTRLTS